MKNIDINADIGEGYGVYTIGNDEAIVPYMTSVNIACGFHAGDYKTMAETVVLAVKHGVHIGAHPGYPDLHGFGRKAMSFTIEEIKMQLLYQIGALESIATYYKGSLHHVKPHGALYNEAAQNYDVAYGIAEVVATFGKEIILVGLCDSEMEKAAKELGVPFWGEVFADRRYQENGLLIPRASENAVIKSVEEMLEQVNILIQKENVKTICVHGDSEKSVTLSKELFQRYGNLEKRGL